MKKGNIFLHVIVFSVIFIFLFMLSSNKTAKFGTSYAYTAGECTNMSSTLLSRLESGEDKLTYECFGAVGDGKADDFIAIKKTHEFANKEYIEKGISLTVHGSSSATYKISSGNSSGIYVLTDVDWEGAKFIIDDNPNVVSENDIYLKPIFRITSPMHVGSGCSMLEFNKSGGPSDCTANQIQSDSSVWSNLSIMKNTTNVKPFVDAILKNTFKSNSSMLKYFESSQIWAISVVDSHKNYIRTGNYQDQGKNQTEMILINSHTGEVLSDIEWNYTDITQVRVWPIPERKVTVQNGEFTTWTNNNAVSSEGVNNSYTQRGIYVAFTGNVLLKNINHYLVENKYPYSGYETEKNKYANAYYGFIKLTYASYVELNTVGLTPHTAAFNKTAKYGTYDLTFDYSNNLFFNKVVYSCDQLKSDGTVDYTSCYGDKMVNDDKWGIIGSNGSKNLFIRNSKINRVDAHRGIRNVLIQDTTIGNKGTTFVGSGNLYFSNVRMDRTNNVVELRPDYGSTWNGNIVINGMTYIIDNDVVSPTLVRSNNNQGNFGYNTYFPALYFKDITIDDETYNANKNVTLMRFNDSATSSGISKYDFKGNVRFTNVKLKKTTNHLYLFSDEFVKNDASLLLETYRGNNVVNIGYYNNDDHFSYTPTATYTTKLQDTTKNTKFTFTNSNSTVTTVNDKIAEVESSLQTIEAAAVMPTSVANSFFLKSISINGGAIALNESISSSQTKYTATIPAGVDRVTLSATGDGYFSSVSYPSTVTMSSSKKTVDIVVIGLYGTRKVYQLELSPPQELIPIDVPTNAYCNNLTYNGKVQVLTKTAPAGFTFQNNSQFNAGDYAVKAVLKNGYQWSDGTKDEKTILCKIQKMTPTITVSSSSMSVALESKTTLTVTTNVKGRYDNSISNLGVATITPMTTIDHFVNQKCTITVSAVKTGNATITISFTPSDTVNFQAGEKTVSVTVKEKAPEVKKAAVPTSSFCSEVAYNGSDQELVKPAGEGFTFSNTKGKDAGVYNVKATLISGYQWADGSMGEKTFQCRIEKASPTITLTPNSSEVAVGGKTTFNVKTNVKGKYEITSQDAKIATASPDGTADVSANEDVTITVSGNGNGSTQVVVKFTPTDTTNYKSSSEKSFEIKVGSGSSGDGGNGGSGGGSGESSGAGTLGGTSVVPPTAATYCNNVRFNGEEQVLTKEAGEGFHFIENKQTNAGEYAVKAVLESGYQWNDNTVEDKKLNCSIQKAIPTVEYHIENKQIVLSGTREFTESANVKGTFTNSSILPTIVSISNGEKSEVLAEHTPATVSLSGLVRGSSYIKVTFSPVDAVNWEMVTKSFRVYVQDKVLENFDDGNDNVILPSDKRYSVGKTFLYTGNETSNSIIEANLKFKENVTHEFQDGKLVLKNSDTNEEQSLSLLSFSSSYTLENDYLYIPDEMALSDFLAKFQKNGVEVSVEKLNGENVSDGSIVNIMFGEQILDSFMVKIKAPVQEEVQEEEEKPLFNPILLIVGAFLIVVAVVILIVSKKKKKPKFIQQGDAGADPNQAPQDPNQNQPPPNMGPYFQ